jgi:hypothetical protein
MIRGGQIRGAQIRGAQIRQRLRTLLARALYGLYPRRWRARYGDELADCLARSDLTARGALALLAGAVDAHLNLTELMEGWTGMSARLRTTIWTSWVTCVALGFAAAGAAKANDDGRLMAAERSYRAARVAFTTVQAAFVIALAVIVVGAVPIAVLAARDAWRARAWPMLGRLAFPAAALMVIAGTAALLGVLARHDPSLGHVTGYALFILWNVAVLALVITSALALRTVIRAAILPPAVVRLATVTAAIAALLVSVGAIAFAAWGIALHADSARLLGTGAGLLGTPFVVTWGPLALAAIGAAAAAGWNAARGLRALAAAP